MSNCRMVEYEIGVTHVVDPYKFWYFHVEDLLEHANTLHRLEKPLQKIFVEKQSKQAEYRIRDYVVVDFVPLGTLIRCVVLDVSGLMYTVWAIDYGFPLKTVESMMAPLPAELSYVLPFIHNGGLANVLPHGNASKWNQEAMDLFSEIIESGNSFKFLTRYKLRNKHILGHLQLDMNRPEEEQQKKDGTYEAAGDILIARGVGVKADYNFYNFINKELANEFLYTTHLNAGENSMPNNSTGKNVKLIFGKVLEISDKELQAPSYPRYKFPIFDYTGDCQSQPNEADCAEKNADTEEVSIPETSSEQTYATSKTQNPFDRTKDISQWLLSKPETKPLEDPHKSDTVRNYTFELVEQILDTKATVFKLTRTTQNQFIKTGKNKFNKIKHNFCKKNGKLFKYSIRKKPIQTCATKYGANKIIKILKQFQLNITSKSSKNIENVTPRSASPHTLSGSSMKSEEHKKQLDQVDAADTAGADVEDQFLSYSTFLSGADWNFQSNFISQLVLAHSSVLQNPIQSVFEVNFAASILRNMRNMNYNVVFRSQSYAWPHLLRGHSMILINSPNSGRTWSYLPAVCNIVYEHIPIDDNNDYGPLAIVLVRNARQAEYVCSVCNLLIPRNVINVTNVVAIYSSHIPKDTRLHLINGCGILVITPAKLNAILQLNRTENLISERRLKVIVLDEVDAMQHDNPEQTKFLLQELRRLHKKAYPRFPQLIAIAEHWQTSLIQLLRSGFANDPLLLFGDFLEAAVYGHVNLKIKFAPARKKMELIKEYLEKDCKLETESTVIFCRTDDDIQEVGSYLRAAGYQCIEFLENADILTQLAVQKWKQQHAGMLLICTDNSPELQLRSAFHLINYSMPKSWSKFKFRFLAISNALHDMTKCPNCLQPGEHAIGHTPGALVILDDNCGNNLPRIVDFLKIHQQQVHPKLEIVAKQIQQKREQKRIDRGFPLCDWQLTFGECNKDNCKARHGLTRSDFMLDINDDNIPMDGHIELYPLKVYTPTHLAVTVIRHKPDASDSKWHPMPQMETNFILGFELNMHFQKIENRRVNWPPQERDVCVMKTGLTFSRLRILHVPEILNPNVVDNRLSVLVKMLDCSTDIITAQSGDLLYCPPYFADLPAMAFDVRLSCGLVPFDGESDWERKAKILVQQWCDTYTKNRNQKLMGTIDFALKHTIFLKQLVIIEHLPSINTYIREKDWKYYLVTLQFARIDSNALHKTQAFINEARSAYQYELEKKLKEDTVPGASIDNAASALEKDADTAEQAEQPSESIAFHDIDTTTDIAPCETWLRLPLNEKSFIDLYCEAANGFWIDFLIIDESKMEAYDSMMNFIEQQVPFLPVLTADDLLSNNTARMPTTCILKHNDSHRRAKLIDVDCGSVEPEFLFLLPDDGLHVRLEPNDLKKNVLHRSTFEIVEMLPYQTARCRLDGITILNCDADRTYKLSDDQSLFVLPLREMSGDPDGIYLYEVRLFAVDKKGDVIEINRKLVELGMAVDQSSAEEATSGGASESTEGHDSEKDQLQPVTTPLEYFQHALNTLHNLDESSIDSAMCFFDTILNNKTDDKQEPPLSKEELQTKLNVASSGSMKEEKAKSVNQLSADSDNPVLCSPRPTLVSSIKKHPQVTWYQSSAIIHLSIQLVDTEAYEMSCDGKTLIYYAHGKEPLEAFLMQLWGVVRQEFVHERYGTRVAVKLFKICVNIWPSLLRDGEERNLNWLKYNIEHLQTMDPDSWNSRPLSQSGPGYTERYYSESDKSNNDDNDDEENDSEENPY